MADELIKNEDIKKLPRTFMGPAYVLEKEPGVFAMYRDILIEENGVKEKYGKPIGPMFLLRPAKKDEPVDFMTSRADGTVIQLHRFHPPRPVEDMLPPDYQAK